MASTLSIIVSLTFFSFQPCYSAQGIDNHAEINKALIELLKQESNEPKYDTKKLEELLASGGDVNTSDEEGNTLLHLASLQRLPTAIDLLLKKGAKLNVMNKSLETPLMVMGQAASFGFGTPPSIVQSIKMVFEKFNSILKRAAAKPSPNTITELGLNLQDDKGDTLLHQLLKNRFNEEANFAIQAGSPINIFNKDHELPFHLTDTLPLIQEMAKKGANFKEKNGNGKTIFSLVPVENIKEVYEIIKKEQGEKEASLVMLVDPVIVVEETTPPGNHLLSLYISDSKIACPLLEKEVSALEQWKLKTDKGSSPLSKASCDCNTIKCSISLENSIPDFMKQTFGKSAACNGPNCFNTALLGNKNLQGFRHVGSSEINFFLSSNSICREKSPEEKRNPGDIIIIYHKAISFGDLVSDGPIHGFTYLTDKFSYSKASFDKIDPYLYTSTSDVFNHFSVYPKLQNVSSKEIVENGEIKNSIPFDSIRQLNGFRYAVTYECITKEYPKAKNKALAKIDTDLDKTLCDVEATLFKKEPAESQLKKWSSSVTTILNKLSKVKIPSSHDKKTLDMALINSKVSSLKDQIDLLQKRVHPRM